MTDEELQKLYNMGVYKTWTGRMTTTKNEICLKAWEHIEWLEEERCNLKDYIETLKRSHAMLAASRKMDCPL